MSQFYDRVDNRDAQSVHKMITSGIDLKLDDGTSFNIHFNAIIIFLSVLKLIFSPRIIKDEDEKIDSLIYNANLDGLDLTKHIYERELPDGSIEKINLYDYFLMNGFNLFNLIYQELPIVSDLKLFFKPDDFVTSYYEGTYEEIKKQEQEEYSQYVLEKTSKLSDPSTDRTENKPYLSVSVKIPETIKDYDLFTKKIKMMLHSGFIYNGEYLNYILLVFNPNINFVDIDNKVKEIFEYIGQSVFFKFKISETDISVIKSLFVYNREFGNHFNISLNPRENVINLSLQYDSSSGRVISYGNITYTRPDGSVVVDTCSLSLNKPPNIQDTFTTFWHTHPDQCDYYNELNDKFYPNLQTHLGGLFSAPDIKNYYFMGGKYSKSPVNFVFAPEGIYSSNISKKFYKIVSLLNYKGRLDANFIKIYDQYYHRYDFLNQMREIKTIHKFNIYTTDLLKNDIFLNQVYYTFYNEMIKTYPTFNDFTKDVNRRCKTLNVKINKYKLEKDDKGRNVLVIPPFKKVWIKELDEMFDVSLFPTKASNVYRITPYIKSITPVKDKVLHFYFYDQSGDIVLKILGKMSAINSIEHIFFKDMKFDVSYEYPREAGYVKVEDVEYSNPIKKRLALSSPVIHSFKISNCMIGPDYQKCYLEGPHHLNFKGEISLYSDENYDKCIFDTLKPILMKTGDIDHSADDIYPENSLIFYRILIMFFINTQTIGKVYEKSIIDSIKILMEQDDVKEFLRDKYQMTDSDIEFLKNDIESIELIDIHFDHYPEQGKPFISKKFCCIYDYPDIFSSSSSFSISENQIFTVDTGLLPY